MTVCVHPCTLVNMIELGVREFRGGIKAALDRVILGEEVCINRGGILFRVSLEGRVHKGEECVHKTEVKDVQDVHCVHTSEDVAARPVKQPMFKDSQLKALGIKRGSEFL